MVMAGREISNIIPNTRRKTTGFCYIHTPQKTRIRIMPPARSTASPDRWLLCGGSEDAVFRILFGNSKFSRIDGFLSFIAIIALIPSVCSMSTHKKDEYLRAHQRRRLHGN
jgi:hypothetical protein